MGVGPDHAAPRNGVVGRPGDAPDVAAHLGAGDEAGAKLKSRSRGHGPLDAVMPALLTAAPIKTAVGASVDRGAKEAVLLPERAPDLVPPVRWLASDAPVRTPREAPATRALPADNLAASALTAPAAYAPEGSGA